MRIAPAFAEAASRRQGVRNAEGTLNIRQRKPHKAEVDGRWLMADDIKLF